MPAHFSCRSIAFVACVGKKRAGIAPARSLYTSAWFVKARSYAEQHADAWYILSARHGLITPDQPLEPYEQTLNTMPHHKRQRWATQVWRAIVVVADVGDRLVFLAGLRYRELVVPVLVGLGYTVEVPMLGLGIGRQLAWLEQQSREGGNTGTPGWSNDDSNRHLGRPPDGVGEVVDYDPDLARPYYVQLDRVGVDASADNLHRRRDTAG